MIKQYGSDQLRPLIFFIDEQLQNTLKLYSWTRQTTDIINFDIEEMAPLNNQSQSIESGTTVIYNFSLDDITKSNDRYKRQISSFFRPTKSNRAANKKQRTSTSILEDSTSIPKASTSILEDSTGILADSTSILEDSPGIKVEREEVFVGLGTMEKAPMTLFRRRRNYRSQYQDISKAGFEYSDSISKGQNSKHINPRTAHFMLRREQGLRRLLTLSDDQTSHAQIMAAIVARDSAKASVLNKTNTGSR
ncbi:hypothetical protein BOTCAL_0796g00030 [Botryotinia calthae]|uniref:Uncharacterized protein n=1 Tax=Botryotinia calthae TaxID=38488 RepID=A0A4Y8CIJ4_9HELO|nr:hypothetical protein BOTCAL_0796g00030 [Botryotinia calthae]